MEAALAEVRRLGSSTSDDATRNRLIVELRNTLFSIESEDDTIDRIIFSVRDPRSCYLSAQIEK